MSKKTVAIICFILFSYQFCFILFSLQFSIICQKTPKQFVSYYFYTNFPIVATGSYMIQSSDRQLYDIVVRL